MICVIFEVVMREGQHGRYLDLAAALGAELEGVEGFIAVERFQSLGDPRKLLSLSSWRDEAAVAAWRARAAHRAAMGAGRRDVFADYRLRVAGVIRDYGMTARAQAPQPSPD